MRELEPPSLRRWDDGSTVAHVEDCTVEYV